MKDRGRKMIVTTVKRRMAASWRSLFASIRRMFWEFDLESVQLDVCTAWHRSTETYGTHIGSSVDCANVHLFEACNAVFRRLYTMVEDGLLFRG